MEITSETPVRDIAVEFPAAILVLERLNIDYCCGGKHTMAEACTKGDLSVIPYLRSWNTSTERDFAQNSLAGGGLKTINGSHCPETSCLRSRAPRPDSGPWRRRWNTVTALVIPKSFR